MAFTYTWEITGLKTKNEVLGDGVVLPNAVCQTYWTCKGIDAEGNEGTFSGATPFSAANLSPEDFQAFDTLTEEIVLGWIQDVVVGSYKEHVDSMIQRQIDEKAISDAPMPWKPEEEQVTPAAE